MTAAAVKSKRGRKPNLRGELARQGARGLQHAALALQHVARVPVHFGEHAADYYALLVSDLAEAGALARSDVPLIQAAARAYERWRTLDEHIAAAGGMKAELGNKGFLSGEAQARAAALKELRTLQAELGCTPVARMRSAGAAQMSLLDLLGPSEPASGQGGPVDPYAPNVVKLSA